MHKLNQCLWDEQIENSYPQAKGVSVIFVNSHDKVDRLTASAKDILANRRKFIAL